MRHPVFWNSFSTYLINYWHVHNYCSFDFEIEFEANPKPDVTWEMQVEKGRNGETVKEGKSKGNYEALDIEEDVSSARYPKEKL